MKYLMLYAHPILNKQPNRCVLLGMKNGMFFNALGPQQEILDDASPLDASEVKSLIKDIAPCFVSVVVQDQKSWQAALVHSDEFPVAISFYVGVRENCDLQVATWVPGAEPKTPKDMTEEGWLLYQREPELSRLSEFGNVRDRPFYERRFIVRTGEFLHHGRPVAEKWKSEQRRDRDFEWQPSDLGMPILGDSTLNEVLQRHFSCAPKTAIHLWLRTAKDEYGWADVNDFGGWSAVCANVRHHLQPVWHSAPQLLRREFIGAPWEIDVSLYVLCRNVVWDGFNSWNSRVAIPWKHARRWGQRTTPFSFVPFIKEPDESTTSTSSVTASAAGTPDSSDAGPQPGRWALLYDKSGLRLATPDVRGVVRSLQFHSIVKRDGADRYPLVLERKICPIVDEEKDMTPAKLAEKAPASGITLGFCIRAAGGQVGRQISLRLGSLDFSVDSRGEEVDNVKVTATLSHLDEGAGLLRLREQGRLRVVDVAPSGQDVVRHSSQAPLVTIVDNSSVWLKQANLELDASYVPAESKSSFVVKLFSEEGNEAKEKVVLVIDPGPFHVSASRIATNTGGVEVAQLSTDGTSGQRWTLNSGKDGVVDADGGLHLMFPPQAVAETMLHRERKAGEGDTPPPIEVRFAPTTLLRVQPTPFKANYVEAPWNTRRLFATYDRRAPGVELSRLEAEFLLGLATTVEKTDGSAPQLRISDIAVERGPLVNAGEPRWSELDKSRPMVLGISRAGRPALSAVIEHPEVKFHVREVEKNFQGGLRAAFPAFGADAEPTPWEKKSERIEWIDRLKEATDGVISRAYLSALGGWASQKADFEGGLVSVATETDMGRASRITVSRLGRIGVLYNRARHVIVYERTVIPLEHSNRAQTESSNNDPAPIRENVPTLRRVREYVEILEVRRDFSRDETQPARRGFLSASWFQSRIINVRSSWGRRTENGVAIPLWREGEDPVLYPRPNVFLEAKSADEGAPDPVRFQIGSLDLLQFFTSNGTSDPAVWPAEPDVDYADIEDIENLDWPSNDPRVQLERPPETTPGKARFAWRLLESDEHAELSRGASAVSAQPRVVSMSRAGQTRAAPTFSPANSGMAGESDLTTLNGALNSMISVARGTALIAGNRVPSMGLVAEAKNLLIGCIEQTEAVLGVVEAEALRFSGGELAKLVTRAKLGLTAACDHLAKRVDEQAQALATTEEGARELAIAQAIERLRGDVRAVQESVASMTDDLPLAALKDAILRGISAAYEYAHGLGTDARLNEFLLAEKHLNGKGQGWDNGLRDRVRNLVALSSAAIDQLTVAITESISAAGSVLGSSPDEVAAAAEAAKLLKARLDELWSLLASNETENNASVRAKIEEVLATNFFATAQRAANKLEVHLAKELDKIFSRNNDALDDYLNKIVVELKKKPSTPGEVQSALGAAKTELEDVIYKSVDPWIEQASFTFQSESKRLQNRLTVLRSLSSITDPEIHRAVLRNALESVIDVVSSSRARLVRTIDIESTLSQDAWAGRWSEAKASLARVKADGVLRLERMVGLAPGGLGLAFKPDVVSYVWREATDDILMSPTRAFLDTRAALDTAVDDARKSALQALGLEAPVQGLRDGAMQLAEAALKELKVKDVLSSLATLKDLFDVRIPDDFHKNVKLRNGVDRRTKSAWASANIDTRIAEPITVFSTPGLFSLRLVNARLLASTEMTATLSGQTTVHSRGEVEGDWEFRAAGGFKFFAFERTRLSYDEAGRFHFSVDPTRISLDPILSWVSEATREMVPESDFFQFSWKELDGRPVGVVATMNIPPLGAMAATSGIANLSLSAHFGVDAANDDLEVAVGLSLGRPDAPFTFSVFVLGGAGWISGEATYRLSDKKVVRASAEIALAASAAIGFSFGPFRGMVAAYFGLNARIGATTELKAFVLLSGTLSVGGFISVSISYGAEATYVGKAFVVTGKISVKVKISRFFRFRASTSFNYTLPIGRKRSSAKALVDSDSGARADAYLQMFGVKQ